jgi:hypothetical protein
VEAAISASQEVYADARVSVSRSSNRRPDARLWKALANDDGQLLWDVMPKDVYQQFQSLNDRHVGAARVEFERFRPFQATDLLRERAMQRLTLTSDGGLVTTIRNLTTKHHVKFMALPAIEGREWDRVIRERDKTPREADLACAKARLGAWRRPLPAGGCRPLRRQHGYCSL